MMNTWKSIEKSREIRLWIKEIIVPMLFVGGITGLAFKEEIKEAYNNLKNCFKK